VTGAGVDRWFFIRYGDPDRHVRLRLHGDPAALSGQVLPALVALLRRWQEEWLLGRYVLDEYDPEWERYGGPLAQDEAERVFQADSEAAIALLRLARRPDVTYDLDTLSAISVAALAAAFGTAAGDAAAGADPAAVWLAGTGSRRDLPAGFHQRRAEWCRLVDPIGGWAALAGSAEGRLVLDVLAPRDEAVRRYAGFVRDLARQGRCPTPEVRVVGSLLHMACNRLFGSGGERETTVLGLARSAVLANADRRRHQR
jgi:thiopeptide-type bacteriocin biosynthesis protein